METIPVCRDRRWDAIRGLLLIIMTIDHFPSGLKHYLEDGLGFTTAAEGFFFLAGFVAGLSYRRTLSESGLSAVISRSFCRAGKIYIFHLCTFLIVLGVKLSFDDQAALAGKWGWNDWQGGHFFLFLLRVATLHFQPAYFDILPMYFFLILTIPPVMFCLRRKLWWLVLSESLGLWLLAQTGESEGVERGFFIGMFGWFNILSWQILFIFGMVLGYHQFMGRALTLRPKGWGLFSIIFLGGLLFLFRHGLLPGSETLRSEMLTGKPYLGPVRLLNFMILAMIISSPQLWPDRAFWTRAFGFLGRHSLPVFCSHIIFLYIYLILIVPNISSCSGWAAALAIVSAGLLYLPAWAAEMMAQTRRIKIKS